MQCPQAYTRIFTRAWHCVLSFVVLWYAIQVRDKIFAFDAVPMVSDLNVAGSSRESIDGDCRIDKVVRLYFYMPQIRLLVLLFQLMSTMTVLINYRKMKRSFRSLDEGLVLIFNLDGFKETSPTSSTLKAPIVVPKLNTYVLRWRG